MTTSKRPPEGFRYIRPTTEEVAEYRRGHHDHRPSVHRLECLGCGKRIWGSGLGVGSHRRACPEAGVAFRRWEAKAYLGSR